MEVQQLVQQFDKKAPEPVDFNLPELSHLPESYKRELAPVVYSLRERQPNPLDFRFHLRADSSLRVAVLDRTKDKNQPQLVVFSLDQQQPNLGSQLLQQLEAYRLVEPQTTYQLQPAGAQQ